MIVAVLSKKSGMQRPYFDTGPGGEGPDDKLDAFNDKLGSDLDKKLDNFNKGLD